jgi:hypothetical protein
MFQRSQNTARSRNSPTLVNTMEPSFLRVPDGKTSLGRTLPSIVIFSYLTKMSTMNKEHGWK